MLNFDRRTPQLLSEEILKKQRGVLLVVAFLLLVGGLMCLINPFATGTVLSIFDGVLLMLSGAGLVVGMFANRAQNTWPTIGGILLGIAYLLFGYVFITSPLAGILALAVYLAVLFAFGGIARLVAGYVHRGLPGNWLQFVIGILDLVIAWTLIGSGPEASVTLVTAIVGIEMLVSSFGLFQAARLFKRG